MPIPLASALLALCCLLQCASGVPRPKLLESVNDVRKEDTNCSALLDVVFLLDSSGSIRQFYDSQKSLTAELIEQFQVGYNSTRVALVQYSGYPQVEFSLDAYHYRDEILQKLSEVQFRSGVTRTGAAINEAKRQFLTSGRTDADKILILMTDGISLDDPQIIAKTLRDSHKVSFYCVSFPDDGYMPELREIAGGEGKVFFKNQLDRLKSEVKNEVSSLTYKRCNTSPITTTTVATSTLVVSTATTSTPETFTNASIDETSANSTTNEIFVNLNTSGVYLNLTESMNDTEIGNFSSQFIIPTPEEFLSVNTNETANITLPKVESSIKVINVTKGYPKRLRSLLAFVLHLSRLDRHLLDRLSTAIDQRLDNHFQNITEMSLNATDNHMVDMITDMIMHNNTNTTNMEKIISGMLEGKLNMTQVENGTDLFNLTESTVIMSLNSSAENIYITIDNDTNGNDSETVHKSHKFWIPRSNSSLSGNFTLEAADYFVQPENLDPEKTNPTEFEEYKSNLTESVLTAEALEQQIAQMVRRTPQGDTVDPDRIAFNADTQSYQREETRHIPTDAGCATDVIFLLDSSGSMSNHFITEKDLINSLVKDLEMPKHRVAIVQFAGTENQRIELDFNDFQTKEYVMHVLEGLEHQKGTTAFGKALNFTTELLLSKRRPSARSVMVLLTDGFSQDDAVLPARIISDQLKTKIFCVGFEELNDRNYLEKVVGNKHSVYIGPAERDIFKTHFKKFINSC